jgi:hypothetical protein
MKITVSFELTIPDAGFDEEQILAWLQFELGENGWLDGSNPLSTFAFADLNVGAIEFDVLESSSSPLPQPKAETLPIPFDLES